MIIAIDFDSTICTGTYPRIEAQRPEAGYYIRRLKQQGHYIIINTCRCGDFLIDAINWLIENNIPFDRVNDNEPKSVQFYQNNSRKIYAHLYIDDKQIGGLPSWEAIYRYVCKKEKEYNQKTAQR